MDTPLWQPTPNLIQQSAMWQFMEWVNQRHQLTLTHYAELHRWSITHTADFWQAIALFCAIQFNQTTADIVIPQSRMQDCIWFPQATLNFAANLLHYRNAHTALIAITESGQETRLSYADLYQQTLQLAAFFKRCGVKPQDRIVGLLPNTPITVIAMLAATSLGAIWSACSPDFGITSVLARFQQIEPTLLLAIDSHDYGGKHHHHLADLERLRQQLPSLTHAIVVPYNQSTALGKPSAAWLDWQDCLTESATTEFEFTPFPFDHPVYILYSSGTTGKPKCMVHGAGGTLLQQQKELRLHTNLTRNDTIFFYTTCSWMMWHWLINSLAIGATVVLYEGSPFYPTATALFDLIDQANITVCGLSAKYIDSLQKQNLAPRQTHRLTTLRTILTTGSPLLADNFDYVYQSIKPDVQLSSISGGSDIISCFALGNPLLPVYRGELQCLGLGMDVQIFNSAGKAIQDAKGELVCTKPFPSRPIYFWNDPQGMAYQNAYFNRFPDVWAHGDYAATTLHGGLIIYGRSDATLNPNGIRIGAAEIYQPLEGIPGISDALVVGRQTDNNEEIILFVTLQPGYTLTPELIQTIKTTLRQQASPHHIPTLVIEAPDIPKTFNGKTTELAVKRIINRQPISGIESLANPQSLDFFHQLINSLNWQTMKTNDSA